MGQNIRSYRELRVYLLAFKLAMEVFEVTKYFPPEEKYSLTDQIRRSSRSVCANLAEAWRKRRYSASFISKLNDSETEASEVQVWIEFSEQCGYLPKAKADLFLKNYETVISQIVHMIDHPDDWIIRPKTNTTQGVKVPASPRPRVSASSPKREDEAC